MANVLVMHENYASSGHYSAFTYSSQNPVMPASNVLDGTRRTRVWRSLGQWVITSANKAIVFQESAGVNVTANIVEGTYGSDASFLTAVKAALDTAGGAPTYTVTRNSTTNKIIITSNGSGGAVFRLMCTNAGFTSAAILGFSTSVDRTGALTYTADNLKIHTSEWLKFDLGSSFNPKAFFIIGERNSPMKLSESALIKVQGNGTDSWSAPEFEQTLSYTEFGIGAFSQTGLHTQALRYWRLYIEDPGNLYGYVEISNLYLGDAVVATRGAVQFPLNTELIDLSEKNYARSGLSLSNEIQLTEQIDLSWALLTKTEKEELEDFVREVGLSKPFFLCLDPGEVFSQDLERMVRYVKFVNGPGFTLVSPNNFSSDWLVREEL